MATGPITVTVNVKRRRTYWVAVCLCAVCTMLGVSSDRAAKAVARLAYRITVGDQ